MLHLRLIVPEAVAADVLGYLHGDAAVTNVVSLPGAALEPAGDLILADVAREGASEVLDCLRQLGLEKDGSIALESVDVSLSEVARAASKAAPGHGADGVVWEEVEARTHEETTLSITYLVFMTVATMIAGIAVVLDQPILIIGAMVVGPEFGPLAGLCVALVQRQAAMAVRSAVALLVGFPVGMLGTILLTWAMTSWGLLSEKQLLGRSPAHLVHLAARRHLLDRRVPRRRGRDPLADLGEVGSVGRRADLGDDRAGRRERRGGDRVRGLGGSVRLRRPACPQRERDRRGRHVDAGDPAILVVAPGNAGAPHRPCVGRRRQVRRAPPVGLERSRRD